MLRREGSSVRFGLDTRRATPPRDGVTGELLFALPIPIDDDADDADDDGAWIA